MKVISIMNMKGGVGKTTLAVNISHILNKEFGHRVLTIDIDPQFTASQLVFQKNAWQKILREEIHTAIRIFLDKDFDSIEINGEYVEPLSFPEIGPKALSPNWHFIPGSIYLYDLELTYFKILKFKLREYMDYLRRTNRYDFVIIDTPPTPSSWMRTAIIASDYYLMPVKPDSVSVMGIPLLMRIIRKIKEEENESEIQSLGMVFNMCENLADHKDQMNKLATNEYLQLYAFENKLKKRAHIARISHEHTLFEDRLIYNCGSSEARKEIIEITKELKQRINR